MGINRTKRKSNSAGRKLRSASSIRLSVSSFSACWARRNLAGWAGKRALPISSIFDRRRNQRFSSFLALTKRTFPLITLIIRQRLLSFVPSNFVESIFQANVNIANHSRSEISDLSNRGEAQFSSRLEWFRPRVQIARGIGRWIINQIRPLRLSGVLASVFRGKPVSSNLFLSLARRSAACGGHERNKITIRKRLWKDRGRLVTWN